MAKIKEINLKGEQVKELTLNDDIFKIEGNDVNQQGNSKNYVLRKIIGF